MLDEIELIQVREYMTDVLPETLPQDSKFVGTIAEVMAERFPRRDEFARLAGKVEHLADKVEHLADKVEHLTDEFAT